MLAILLLAYALDMEEAEERLRQEKAKEEKNRRNRTRKDLQKRNAVDMEKKEEKMRQGKARVENLRKVRNPRHLERRNTVNVEMKEESIRQEKAKEENLHRIMVQRDVHRKNEERKMQEKGQEKNLQILRNRRELDRKNLQNQNWVDHSRKYTNSTECRACLVIIEEERIRREEVKNEDLRRIMIQRDLEMKMLRTRNWVERSRRYLIRAGCRSCLADIEKERASKKRVAVAQNTKTSNDLKNGNSYKECRDKVTKRPRKEDPVPPAKCKREDHTYAQVM
ncbi:hypothetical protein O0L34_g11455 [Tuta absoluta]|nr:hypothetical protein O0L34_g11455 [Tuta absoluta]